jgi:AraC-like DNA-binding protein
MPNTLFDHANAVRRVAGSYLQPLLDAAANRGVRPQALEAAAGLHPGSLHPLPDSLPADTYVALLDTAAELAGDAHFGLHVGERVKLGTYSVYGLILLSCRDFGQALQQTIRYEQLAHDLGRSSVQLNGNVAEYGWHSNYPAHYRHLVDSVFAGIRTFGNWLAGAPLPAGTLSFMHDGGDPAGHAEYVRVFGTLPRFSAASNTACVDAAMLAWPVPNADVSLYPVLQQHAEALLQERSATAAGVVAQVQACMARGMSQGQARLATVAAQLGLAPRTLQRKLTEAGTTFQQVLDSTRFSMAKDYLAQPGLSLVDIAFLLGFQEQSAFNHAFREWAGINPGAWRAALR